MHGLTASRALAIALLVVGFQSVPANAGLIGSSLGWQAYWGGGPFPPGPGESTNGTFIDSGGIGGTYIGGVTYLDIIADDNSITFDYSVNTEADQAAFWATSGLSLAPTIHNGIAINLLSAGAFTAVSIDPATNMAGFGAADLSFTGNQIQVDWQGLFFNASTIVKLDVASAATPEPCTFGMVGLSALAVSLGYTRKARKKLT